MKREWKRKSANRHRPNRTAANTERFLRVLAAIIAAIIATTAIALASDAANSSSSGASLNHSKVTPLELTYRARAERDPQDVEAFQGMAILQMRRNDFADAIKNYSRALELNPADHDSKVGLARALAFSGQYDAALERYQKLLEERADDTDALDGLARAEAWRGHPDAAFPIFQKLVARYPGDPDYAVGLARVETTLHRYSEARDTLNSLLKAQPRNRDAQLQLAYLDLFENHQSSALRRFNRLIRQDPTDADALKGNARIAYYRGDLVYARALAAGISNANDRDVSALLLLANVERALHHRRQAWALVERAQALDSGNVEAHDLEASLINDSRPTLHTSASFAREIATGSPENTEDLTAFGYATTWGFFTLPRSEAYVSLDYLPSQSPSGGIQGAAAPSQVFYRQTFYAKPQLTLRGGVGLVRFGPADLVSTPSEQQPIESAGTRPLGFGSLSYVRSKKLTVDVTAGRSAVTYTPTAVRLGVVDNRLTLGLNYQLDSRTTLRVEPFAADDATMAYPHRSSLAPTTQAAPNLVDHNRSTGVDATLNRSLVHRPQMSLDVGYAGLAYRIDGGMFKPYLGFFNPSFYQRHYVTTHVTGRIYRSIDFDFSAGAGVQQIETATPLKPALLLSTSLIFKASSRLSITAGYTHYDSSQSLGTLRGNAARISTDWRF